MIVPTFHSPHGDGSSRGLLRRITRQFTLGIGLSHEPMMAQLGVAFDRPIHLREYLNVLMPLLRDGGGLSWRAFQF